VALVDNLIAAQTRLISSYMRIGSSVVGLSRLAAPIPDAPYPQRTDDHTSSAGEHSDPAPAVPADSIEARAYEIFVRRGRRPGNPVDDWRRAEAELRGEMIG
jgi:hypothetical protein